MRRLAVAFLVGSALAFVLVPVPASAGGGGDSGVCTQKPESVPARVVYVTDTCFAPRVLRVTTGLPVTWRLWKSLAPHTVTSSNALFDSGDLADTFTVTFNEPGTFDYVCVYHGGAWGGMIGKVVVEGEDLPGTDSVAVLEVSTPEDDPQVMLAEAEHRLARAIAWLRDENPAVEPEPASVTIPAPAVGLAAISALMVGAVLLVRRRGPA